MKASSSLSSSHGMLCLPIRQHYRLLVGIVVVVWNIHVRSFSDAFLAVRGSSVILERNAALLGQGNNGNATATHPDGSRKEKLELALHQASDWPIFDVLDDICRIIMSTKNDIFSTAKLNMVREGAGVDGKTTVVPLRLLHQDLKTRILNKIMQVAPRRVAVRSYAQRMANMLRQSTGQTVGYAVRQESRMRHHIRIFVTDGRSMFPFNYLGDGPQKARTKLFQLFGTTKHPFMGIGKDSISISIPMLSLAACSLVEAMDFPFFCRELFPSNRCEMVFRYPKHSWPEDLLSGTDARKNKRQLDSPFPAQMLMLPFVQYTRRMRALFSPTECSFVSRSDEGTTDENFRQRNKHWVILVDDEESIRLAVGDFLFEHGYQVTACADADSLLEVLRSEHEEGANHLPDAIISDIRLPLSTKNGYELVEAIRSAPQWTNIPIVMLTAKAMTQDRVQGYKVGADAFLPKPFDPNELLSILDNMIARNKQRMRMRSSDETSIDEAEQSSTPDLLVLKQQLDEIKEIMERNAASTVQKTNVVLTEQERKVLQMICDGCTYSEVAKECNMSVQAVNRFVQKLHDRTEAKTRTELVKWAIQVGYVS
jgi:DNA-binding NarL/FixJ family response regulator